MRKTCFYKQRFKTKMLKATTYLFRILNCRPTIIISSKCSKLTNPKLIRRPKRSNSWKEISKITTKLVSLKENRQSCFSGNYLKRKRKPSKRKDNGRNKDKELLKCGRKGFRHWKRQSMKKNKTFMMKFKA